MAIVQELYHKIQGTKTPENATEDTFVKVFRMKLQKPYVSIDYIQEVKRRILVSCL